MKPAIPRKTLGQVRHLHGAVKDSALRKCADCGLNLLPLAFPRVGDGRGDTCRNCLPHGAPLTPADWL